MIIPPIVLWLLAQAKVAAAKVNKKTYDEEVNKIVLELEALEEISTTTFKESVPKSWISNINAIIVQTEFCLTLYTNDLDLLKVLNYLTQLRNELQEL